LKKTVVALVLFLGLSVAILSCGGSSSTQHKASGLVYRAFVSNSLFPSGATNIPVLNIVDATQDLLSPSTVSLLGTIPEAQQMAVSADLHYTMVFSLSSNSIGVVDNTTEAIATIPGTNTNLPAIQLPGMTESMFVAPDNVTGYAAVPSAPVIGYPNGAVFQMSLQTGAITAIIPVQAAHYIFTSPDGTRILVFSDNLDSITVIATGAIGSSTDPRTVITGTASNHFDRPVWAMFTGNSTALIFNCGPECGGTVSGITPYTLGTAAPGANVAVNGSTYGLVVGSTMYVAGTPPNTPCPPGTAASTCGTLNMLNATTLQHIAGPYLIPDGFHNIMQMGSLGQLFVGSHTCTSINNASGEVRGCLAIFNTTNNQVIVPPQTGDATGIQPIYGRNIVYVCEGGLFSIYDTTTDQLLIQPFVTDIIGQAFAVKLVDPPLN
jgi:hypothetical protein